MIAVTSCHGVVINPYKDLNLKFLPWDLYYWAWEIITFKTFDIQLLIQDLLKIKFLIIYSAILSGFYLCGLQLWSSFPTSYR